MFQNHHFLGLLLSLGTGNIIKKSRWPHAFGGEPQSCGQDGELGLLFQSCQVFESSVIAIAATARPNSLAASVLLSLYSPGDRAWLCKVTDPSHLTHTGCESHAVGFCLNASHSHGWVWCCPQASPPSQGSARWVHLLGSAWELLSSCTMPGDLKSSRLLSHSVYCCFVAFWKDVSFQKTKICLVFSAIASVAQLSTRSWE